MPQEVADGTNLGMEAARALGKPLLVLALEDALNFAAAQKRFLSWLQEHDIVVLNINGPRESSVPGIHARSKKLFADIFAAAARGSP